MRLGRTSFDNGMPCMCYLTCFSLSYGPQTHASEWQKSTCPHTPLPWQLLKPRPDKASRVGLKLVRGCGVLHLHGPSVYCGERKGSTDTREYVLMVALIGTWGGAKCCVLGMSQLNKVVCWAVRVLRLPLAVYTREDLRTVRWLGEAH